MSIDRSIKRPRMDASTVMSFLYSMPQYEQSGRTFPDPSDESYEHIEVTEESENMEPDIEAQKHREESSGRQPENPATAGDNVMEAGKQSNSEVELQLRKRVRNLNEQLEKKNKDYESLLEQSKQLEGQAERLTQQIKELLEQNEQKDLRIFSLEKEVKDLKEPKKSRNMFGWPRSNSAAVPTLKVPRKQVHYTKQPLEQNINNVDATIMGKIQERLFKKNLELSELPWRQDRCHVPSVVFCVYASRLGADVEEVLPDLKESPIILVILHPVHKKRATTSLASAGHLLPREIKSKVSSIVHFAFTKDQGLHNCKPNETALKNLTEILERFPGTAL